MTAKTMNLSQPEIDALLETMTPLQKIEFLEELEEQDRRLKLKQAELWAGPVQWE